MTLYQERRKTPQYTLLAIYGVAATFIVVMLIGDYGHGGSEWKQGDWLINNEELFVRRGLLGSILIYLADFIHVSPLALTIGLQIAMFLATVLSTYATAVRIGMTDRLMLLLLSPGFFVVFWATDPSGSVRKELFIFLSLAILAFAATCERSKLIYILISAVLFCVGISAHEGLVFFLPLYLAVLHVSWQSKFTKRKLVVVIGIIAATAISFSYNLAMPKLASVDPVCRPLISHNLQASICGGAITALTHSLSDEMSHAFKMINNFGPIKVALVFAIGALPLVVYLFDWRRTNLRLVAILVLLGLPFLPLYAVAIDWGRWTSFYITGVTYLVLAMRANGLAAESSLRLPQTAVAVFVLYCLSIGFGHAGTSLRPGGFLLELSRMGKPLLGSLARVAGFFAGNVQAYL